MRAAALWFRITGGLMLLFAAGHTIGFLSFQPASPDGRSVWAAMNSVHFAQGHAVYSYGGFYKGFGLSITVFQLFEAWLAWHMGKMADRGSQDTGPLAWSLLLVQLIGFVLSLKYFAAGPAILSLATAVCLGVGIWKDRQNVSVPVSSFGHGIHGNFKG